MEGTKEENSDEARHTEGIVIKGVDDVLVRFAGCCHPVPGDAIVGYISRGRGITVHTSDCKSVPTMEPERLIPVYWEGYEGKPYPARIHVLAKNVKGVMGEISVLLANNNINIDSGSLRSLVDGKTEIDLTIEVSDVAQLYQILQDIRQLDVVLEVNRVTS